MYYQQHNKKNPSLKGCTFEEKFNGKDSLSTIFFKYNNPVIGKISIIATTILFVGSGVSSIILLMDDGGPITHFWLIWATEILFKTIMPLMVIKLNKNLSSFVLRNFEESRST